MHKGNCKVQSVMMRHLNILKLESNLFGPELFTFSWDFIDCDKGLHIIYWGYGAGNIAYGATTFL